MQTPYKNKQTGETVYATQYLYHNDENIKSEYGQDIFEKHTDIVNGCFIVEKKDLSPRQFEVRTEINFLTCYEK